MRTPSLKAIKTFQIAAKHSSFAVAADELCITPSAVSHQIKTLETQLGLPLFSRSARALGAHRCRCALSRADRRSVHAAGIRHRTAARALRPQQRAAARAGVLRERDAAAAAFGILEAARRHRPAHRNAGRARPHPRRRSRHLRWWLARDRGTVTDRASAVRADHGARVLARAARWSVPCFATRI